MILSASSPLVVHRRGAAQLSTLSDRLPAVCLRAEKGPALCFQSQNDGNNANSRPAQVNHLLKWDELPDWQKKDSSYVETGYRRATPSVYQCVVSWGYLHNETVNIFSHLVGAVLFFSLPPVLYRELEHRRGSASKGDIVVFATYLLGVSACFTLSVIFHTVASHSPEGFAFGIQLDFQGIILLIWSATVPLVYYTFYLEPALQQTYWSLITVLAILSSLITFTPAFHKPATKPLRVGVFGSLALSTLISVCHGLAIHGWRQQSCRFPMRIIGLTLLLNTTAAAAYVSRFPERWWRRTFDLFGASHQLMHSLIVAASLVWVVGIVKAFDYAHGNDRLSM